MRSGPGAPDGLLHIQHWCDPIPDCTFLPPWGSLHAVSEMQTYRPKLSAVSVALQVTIQHTKYMRPGPSWALSLAKLVKGFDRVRCSRFPDLKHMIMQ